MRWLEDIQNLFFNPTSKENIRERRVSFDQASHMLGFQITLLFQATLVSHHGYHAGPNLKIVSRLQSVSQTACK
jgi:hypothetical protein